MKNNLFLTTALVATAFVASNAMAETINARTEINANTTYEDAVTANGIETTSILYGGVLFNNTGVTTTFEKNVTMTNNTNNWVAGAISNGGTSELVAGGTIQFNGLTTFTNNTSASHAGAVYNQGTMNFAKNSIFENNSATANGGAINNVADSTIVFEKDANFSQNTANLYGGAIENGGNITFEGISTFSGNKSTLGGAIHNSGTITYNDLATFNDNYTLGSENGGVIYNSGNITFNNGLKTNNNGKSPDGTKIAGTNISNIAGNLKVLGGDVEITNNFAKQGAGLVNVATGTLTIGTAENALSKVLFDSNETTSTGGAIYNGNTTTIYADNATLTNNKTTAGYAGAVGNMAGSFYLYGKNNKFESNKSLGSVAVDNANEYKYGGGAIQNNSGTVVIGLEDGSSTNKFTGNESTMHGGAVLSRGGTTTFNGNTYFENNTAAVNGGAIHNIKNSVMTFNGNTTFTGNSDSTGANDIYNTGTITFNGDVTLDGGISGDAGNMGSVTFASGTSVNVKANETFIKNNNVTNGGATLNLNLDNGYTGTYVMVDGGTLNNEFTIAENTLYNITATDTKGTYDVSKKSSAEVATETGASQNQAAAVTAITNGEGNNATFNAIAENISDLMQSGSAVGVQLALEAAETLAPEVAPVVLQTATENVGQIFSAVSARLSGGAATAPNSRGMASGDSVFENGAVWAQGLYNHSKLNDTRKAKGYKADSNGLAFGFEKQINENVKAGIGYAYTKTDVDGHNRDLDIDTHTALVYGEYKPSAWFVNAMASYSWSDYDEDKRVLGQKITGDYDAQSYALQAMSGYEFAYDNTIFTPEAGLRYIHISQDGHKDTAGQYVYGSEVDTLTGIAGLRVEQAYALDNGWTLRPSARFAVTYDIANDDGNSAALLANGTAYSVKGEAMDRFGMEADFALTADITDNASVSLGYQGKFRDDYKDHTGLLNLKYNF